MVIFLYGPDTYRMKDKLKEIVAGHKKVHQSGLNLKYFAGEDFKNFEDEIRQTSMFKEKKLVILLNPFDNPEFKRKFPTQVKEFLESDDIIVIYQEGLINKNNSLFRLLQKNAKTQEFGLLADSQLKNWVGKEFKKYKAEINTESLTMLINYTGNNLWRLANEIKKLSSYTKEIGTKDIKLLVRSKIGTDIFKTIDAIAQKNKKQALNLIHQHLEKGDSPLYLLSMINYQFRNLLIIKDLIDKSKPYYFIVKKSGLHPFVVRKTYSLSNKFDLNELKKIYQKIFTIDLQIKTGKVEPVIALDLLIAEI